MWEKDMKKRVNYLWAAGFLSFLASAGGANALVVTQDTNGTDLLNALVPNQAEFGSISASYTAGAAAQVGTYTGFTSLPVTLGNGIVLSTGNAFDTKGPASAGSLPSTDEGGGSTAEINAYAPGHITNWNASFDAARLTVNFSLATPSAVAFSFVFGSIEYPIYVNDFTDAAYVFLDGAQITFDGNGNPVQVGTSFAGSLTTADTNTSFANPHGLIGPLTTTSGLLAAGAHSILFEVADTNDHILDSGLFVSNFHTTEPTGPGPCTVNCTVVPEPASLAALAPGLLALLGIIRRRRNNS
jgi:MYXO-CTERM domain-containing protein